MALAKTHDPHVFVVRISYYEGQEFEILRSSLAITGSHRASVIPHAQSSLGFHIGSTRGQVRRLLGRGVARRGCGLERWYYPAFLAAGEMIMGDAPMVQYTFRGNRVVEIAEFVD